jgi:hypothetical protein
VEAGQVSTVEMFVCLIFIKNGLWPWEFKMMRQVESGAYSGGDRPWCGSSIHHCMMYEYDLVRGHLMAFLKK